jgi:acyl-CoA synthetase (AMP-forming)/AMP-acid ligase II
LLRISDEFVMADAPDNNSGTCDVESSVIYRSPHPDVTIPVVSLPEILLARAEQYGSKTALVDGTTGRSYTFEQFADKVRRTAGGLSRMGLTKGDVVALLAPNSPEYGIVFLAVNLLGGINTTLNPISTREEVGSQIRDAGARFVFTTPDLLDRIPKDTALGKNTVSMGEIPGTTPLEELLNSTGTAPETPIDPAVDVAVLPYSSGTTGISKGVQLTHRNVVANLLQTAPVIYSGDDTILGLPPFFHIYGLTVVLHLGLYLGATDVTLPRFELGSFLDTIEAYKVTHINLVPPLILTLARHPTLDARRLDSLRSVQSGAAPLAPEMAEAFGHRFSCKVTQGYGLSEASPVTHIATRQASDIPLASIGPPVAGTMCRVVDIETGVDLGPGHRGELYVRGPQVMRGYLNDPEKTSAMLDKEGWLRTGDVAYADDQGNFYIVDRVKELIKYKGYPIAPAELEALLLTHPGVADVAVVPSPDDTAGEVPKAFVVRNGPLEAGPLMSWVGERVAPHRKIRRVEFVEEIPRSASGKILRRKLVDRDREE